MSPRSARMTRRFRKLLHFNFLLRALRDLRGELSVSIWVRLRRAGSGVVFVAS